MAYQLTEQDKQLAKQMGMQQYQMSQPQIPKPKQSGGGIGSFLLGLLPGGSLIDKGLKGEQITGGDVATEALLSAVPFGLGKLAKGAKGLLGASKAGLGTRLGKGLENKGQQLLGSQANITRAEGRRIGANPSDVLGSINRRTGLTRMDDMADIAKNITGSNGTFSELTRNAVGNIPGVDIGDIRTMGADILANKAPLITGRQKDSLLESFKNAGVTMRGGSRGSLSTTANPLEALDTSKNFRAMANDITKGATVSAKDRQLANVYNEIAGNIEKSIYKSPGITEGLAAAAPDRAKDLLSLAASAPNKAQARAYTKLAKEMQNIADVPTLRTAQKDFVNLGKIDEATARAAQGAGAQFGDQMQGLGKLAQRPTNLIASPLNAATPGVGGIMTRAGRALQGAGGPGILSNPLAKFLAPQAGVRAGADILGLRNQPTEAVDVMSDPTEMSSMPGAMNGADVLGGPTEPTSIYSRESAAKDIQNDLQATGGANMDKYLKLFEFLNPEGGAGGKTDTNTKKALAQSANAENTLSQLEGMLQSAGGAGGPVGGNIASFFGGIGMNNDAKAYNDLVNGSVTQIAKALGETGAMSDSDRKAYMNLLPKVTDTPEVAAVKFQALRDRMSTAKQNTLQYGAGSGIEEALAAGGY